MRKRALACTLVALAFLCAGCTSRRQMRIDREKAEREEFRAQGIENIENASDALQFPLNLHIGYSTNSNDPRGQAIALFKREVESKTGRNIIISVHPDSEMGSDNEMIEKVINGELDMTVSSAGNYAIYATRIGISALPFLFTDFEVAWRFMDSDIVADVNKDLEDLNIVVLAHFDNGFRCVTTSEAVGPIETVEDLAGVTIRTPDNQIVMETMSELGANPKSFPFAELKDALRDGTFDAQENPIPIIYNNRFFEVQSYLSVTNHSYDAMPLSIRKDIWDRLPKEYQTILSEAALHAQEENRKTVKKQTEDYVELLEQKGMTVVYPNLNVLKEATTGVSEMFSDVYGQDLLLRVETFR